MPVNTGLGWLTERPLSDSAADRADQLAGGRLILAKAEAGELLDFDQRAAPELLGRSRNTAALNQGLLDPPQCRPEAVRVEHYRRCHPREGQQV